MMNEVLNAMRLIKMYAWEEPFTERIIDLRLPFFSDKTETHYCIYMIYIDMSHSKFINLN